MPFIKSILDLFDERLNLGSFTSNKFIYTSLNSSQSNKALCFVLLERSILNFLQSASREFDVPGNLFLATSRESITNFLSNLFLLIALSSPFKNLTSKSALCIINFFIL